MELLTDKVSRKVRCTATAEDYGDKIQIGSNASSTKHKVVIDDNDWFISFIWSPIKRVMCFWKDGLQFLLRVWMKLLKLPESSIADKLSERGRKMKEGWLEGLGGFSLEWAMAIENPLAWRALASWRVGVIWPWNGDAASTTSTGHRLRRVLPSLYIYLSNLEHFFVFFRGLCDGNNVGSNDRIFYKIRRKRSSR